MLKKTKTKHYYIYEVVLYIGGSAGRRSPAPPDHMLKDPRAKILIPKLLPMAVSVREWAVIMRVNGVNVGM